MIDKISFVSSVATLILFVLYFIGRIWVINKNSLLLFENFELDYQHDSTVEYKNLYDIGGNELITISSQQGFNWLKVYEIEYKENKMYLTRKKLAMTHKLLNINEKLYIKIDVPCGRPRYWVEYERFDYIRGRFYIGFDGRFGGLHAGNFKNRKTLKSYFYYICK